jgi:hypothetical protein
MPPIVKQVDHVLIEAIEPHSLFSLMSETFRLPVAWPLVSHGFFKSGGVCDGVLELEVIHFWRSPGSMVCWSRSPSRSRGLQGPDLAVVLGGGSVALRTSEKGAEQLRSGTWGTRDSREAWLDNGSNPIGIVGMSAPGPGDTIPGKNEV